jgi:hypothetical protein
MGVIPPVIPANTALGETIAALRRLDAAHSGGAERSLRGEIEHAIDLRLSEQGTTCLRTACAARNLTMVVSDPRTGSRHAVPAEYFDRPNADIEFSRGLFGAYELSEQVVADPLYKLVHPYRGWVHGFIEPEFRVWLENPERGPQAGSQMRHAEAEWREPKGEPVSVTIPSSVPSGDLIHAGGPDPYCTLTETLVAVRQSDPKISVRRALAILHELCRSGWVSAMGRPCVWPHPGNYNETLRNRLASDERWPDGIVAIMPEDWADLSFVVDDQEQPAGDLDSTAIRRRAWYSIRFSVNSLIRSQFHEWDRIKMHRTRDLRARTTSRRERGLRRSGEWVSVAELVDWIVKEDRAGRTGESVVDALARAKGSFEETLNGMPRPRAYREFWNALQDGEFARDGKTRVLLLNPTTTWARLTPERGRWALEPHGWDTFVSQFLGCSWIEIELADHWLAGWVPRDLHQRWVTTYASAARAHSDAAGGC